MHNNVAVVLTPSRVQSRRSATGMIELVAAGVSFSVRYMCFSIISIWSACIEDLFPVNSNRLLPQRSVFLLTIHLVYLDSPSMAFPLVLTRVDGQASGESWDTSVGHKSSRPQWQYIAFFVTVFGSVFPLHRLANYRVITDERI